MQQIAKDASRRTLLTEHPQIVQCCGAGPCWAQLTAVFFHMLHRFVFTSDVSRAILHKALRDPRPSLCHPSGPVEIHQGALQCVVFERT